MLPPSRRLHARARPPSRLVLALSLALAGCGGRNTPIDLSCGGPLAIMSKAASATAGTARVSFLVPLGTRSFLLTAQSQGGGYANVSELTQPDGSHPLDLSGWRGGTRFLTSAILPLGDEVVLNWPVREVDGPLQSGKWTVGLDAFTSSGAPEGESYFDVTLELNRNGDFHGGCATVRVIETAAVADDPVISDAVERAVAHWQDIYAQVGISLAPSFERSELLPDNLAEPSMGSDIYQQLKESGNEEDLVLVVGETIGGSGIILGEAGAIPGPLPPSRRGVVAVGWLLQAGGDGVLDDVDIEGMGETMAHEMGHYLGLFHPIEVDGYGNPTGYTDALDDTPICATNRACESAVGTNLMYPYRLCDTADCTRQDVITAQQGGVMHRYSGTR